MIPPGHNTSENKWYVNVLTIALGGLILALGLKLFAPFFEPISWAIILALFFFPVNRSIKKFLKKWDGFAAFFMCILIITFIIIPVFILLGALTNEALRVYSEVQGSLHINNLETLTDPDKHPIIHKYFSNIIELVRPHEEALKDAVKDLSKKTGEFFITQGTIIFKNIANLLFKGALMLVTLFYLFRDGERMLDSFKELLPFTDRETENFAKVTYDVLSATLYGNIFTAIIQGGLGVLILWLLDFSAPILWGIIMGLATFIPMVGTALIWVPASIYLFASGLYLKGIILLAFGILVISQIDYFLRPFFISGKTRLNTLFLLFSIIGGLSMFGFLGLILGPIIIALCVSILEIYKIKYLGKAIS